MITAKGLVCKQWNAEAPAFLFAGPGICGRTDIWWKRRRKGLSGEKNSEVIFSCVAEAGVMEQKWFAHVLTSDYPLPAGMSVTAWGQ